MSVAPDLPIHAVMPQLRHALRDVGAAVLVAPPGAGKTTAIAPALLDENWCNGQILLLSPRRLAARAAAERIAQMMGTDVGGLVGYATRLDTRQSAQTRILVMTEGIFRSRIIADPELAGVSAVLFDEVHERNLDSDFGLALAIEARGALRPDLRLLAMSATLDGQRFAALLGDAPVIESEGRSHPLTIRYLSRDPSQAIEEAMARAIRLALRESDGDGLAFLPGVREIERTAERLQGSDAAVHILHGQVEPAAQRAALRRDPEGRRKIVLATSIAETSITIDGLGFTVDSGLARRARFDVAAGTARLVTERVSQAAAIQRAGRAARLGPGIVWRLWEEAATAGLPPYDPPEILEADLSSLVLDCALWGEADPARLPWLDAPPAAALGEARRRMQELGAIDGSGAITDHGRAMARLPLPPALAHMLIEGAARGQAMLAAELAMLLSERGLGGNDVDLARRHARWRTERGTKAEAARAAAARWAGLVAGKQAALPAEERDSAIARLVSIAYPGRVARRRGQSGEDWLAAGGRGYRLDGASSLAAGEWLAVADLAGSAGGARILAAAALRQEDIGEIIAGRGEVRRSARYDAAADRVEAVIERRLGGITLSRGPDPDGGDPAELLLRAVRDHGLAILPWSEADTAYRARARFAGIPGLEDADLMASLDDWLAPALSGKRRMRELSGGALSAALRNRLDWNGQKALERLAPVDYRTPAGSHHAIDYAAEAGPTVTARVQAFFGLEDHPSIGSPPVPLILSLTSPAGRPIQTTRDLPGFWRGSWADVAREMRGRYPKHPWPDRPWEASATLRTKKADAARGG